MGQLRQRGWALASDEGEQRSDVVTVGSPRVNINPPHFTGGGEIALALAHAGLAGGGLRRSLKTRLIISGVALAV